MRESELKLFSIVNLVIHGYDFWKCEKGFTFFLNFIKYFLNKLTPYKQENGLQLFYIVNLAIHGYDFRVCGFFFPLVFGKTDIVTSFVYNILEENFLCGVGMTTHDNNPHLFRELRACVGNK
jgi:hypothetical protein